MRRILLPYDFSPQAQRALAMVLSGIPFGAEVKLDVLHVLDERFYEKKLPGHALPTADALRSYFKSDVARASTPERKLADDPGLTVVSGHPVEEILTRVGDYGAIVIGGQGHGGIAETFLGTTAMRVVREAPVSVYVVKKTNTLAAPLRVMCAVECGEASVHALKEAASFCRLSDASLSLMRVISLPYVGVPYPMFPPYPTQEEMDLERERLASFEAETLKAKIAKRYVASFAVAGIAGDIVLQAARDRIDTIVVGARENSVGKRFIGSVSESVVQRATGDVYVVR